MKHAACERDGGLGHARGGPSGILVAAAILASVGCGSEPERDHGSGGSAAITTSTATATSTSTSTSGAGGSASQGGGGANDGGASAGGAGTGGAGGPQPMLAWLGVPDMDTLISNSAGGITFDTLADSGIAGSVISTGHLADAYPDWLISELTTARSHGLLYVGSNVADPLPMSSSEWDTMRARVQVLADAAIAAGATGMAIDCEPYGKGQAFTNLWDASSGTTTEFYDQALLLAPIYKSVGPVIIYTSSDASYPGSYFDLIGFQASGEHYYGGTNTFPSFLQGLIDGGVDVTVTDASFHWGVQYAGDQGSWASGIAHSVALSEAVYPTMRASVMLWPDNDEGHGFFDPPAIQEAVHQCTLECTGPGIIYNHQLCTGTLVPEWTAWLGAIKAGVQP